MCKFNSIIYIRPDDFGGTCYLGLEKILKWLKVPEIAGMAAL